MVRKSGLKSPLADACKAAAFASSGLKLRRKPLLDRAEILYHDLLRYLAKRMQAPSASDPEPLAIAILLGLYQLLVRLDPIWKRTENFLAGSTFEVDSDMLALLKNEAVNLKNEIALWQKSQSEEIKAVTIDSGPPPKLAPGAGYWPGRVDMYIDLYVSTLWNVSRIARCLLITLITRLSGILCDGVNHDADRAEVSHLVEDMLASIPYHLSEDLQVFLRERHEHTEITNPGRSVGGLLLMHPIYLASYLEIIPSDKRHYFKTCLVWIAQRMGVGQAAFLAQVKLAFPAHVLNSCTCVVAAYYWFVY
ncbi:hypothetical protein N7493_011358 [Penicillium malachiteum]|uniref:Uncharacterized protein n=1 Tax=Penicillium malachiteum TaxID=1324776 RepID=A0AAD6HC01_9EURO|nr:hypothetical protein N7493_011358 [Penicillium malachiteum]